MYYTYFKIIHYLVIIVKKLPITDYADTRRFKLNLLKPSYSQ